MRRAVLALCCLALTAGSAVVLADPAAAAHRVAALALLRQLPSRAEHAAGYDRALFPLWDDADGDGCDTRDEVLIAEATTRPHVGSNCALTGGRWFSPYDGVRTRDPGTFHIDHLVPLAEAWQSGAYRWSTKVREAYANDLGYPADLVAVTAHANRSKGDDEPAQYLPPRRSFRCTYVAWWVAVKWRWRLAVDPAERRWQRRSLTGCGNPTVVRPGRPGVGGGSPAPSGSARLRTIRFDPPGRDDGSAASLDAEYVRIQNTTPHAVRLTGWTLRDTAGHVYRFAATTLAGGAVVTVHTGPGTDHALQRYWDRTEYVWNNDGDTAILRDGQGRPVDRCTYSAASDPVAQC